MSGSDFGSSGLSGAVEAYVKRNAARFHTPGHKGSLPWMDGLAGRLAMYDITEVDGCDSLYLAESAIAETERKYAELFGSSASFLSAGGSTLCIQAMLALAVKPGQKVICGRGCHTSAINAMALLDIEPAWVFPETDGYTGLAEAVTAGQIHAALGQNPGAAAVYVTSPDYYGSVCDIKVVSEVCRAYGAALLVDNAHGSHLRFLEPTGHPINLGADMCCDSLHKTLPVLTGGAALHIKNERYIPGAKRCMSIFGSTSPSYLIMLSMDKALESLSSDFPEGLRRVASEAGRIEEAARDAGFLVPSAPRSRRDPVRLTLGFSAMGYDSDEFMRLARENGIEPEMADGGFAVFMASPQNSLGDFSRLEGFITGLPGKTPLPVKKHVPLRPKSVRSLRESVFADLDETPLEKAAGRVAGSAVAVCPPGIPLVVPGELIDEKLMLYLKNYGISRLNVLK